MYSAFASKKYMKQMKKLDAHITDHINNELKKIKKDPSIGKSLEGPLESYYSHRIDDYRVIYRYDSDTKVIFFMFIGLRKNVYDDFKRTIK